MNSVLRASPRVLPVVLAIALPTGALSLSIEEYSLGTGFSSLGATVELTHYTTDKLRVRGAISGTLGFEVEDVIEGADVLIDSGLDYYAVFVDYYPRATNWRVSGGLIYSPSSINATTVAAEDNVLTFSDSSFFGGEVLKVNTDFTNEFIPVVTAGYDFPVAEKWKIGGELGLMYTGGVDAVAQGSTAVLQDALDADEELQQEIRDAQDIVFAPFFSLTATYRF